MLDLEAIKTRWLSPNFDANERSVMAVTDIPALIAGVERLQWDYDEAMRQYDLQQKRACDAETEIERLQKALKALRMAGDLAAGNVRPDDPHP